MRRELERNSLRRGLPDAMHTTGTIDAARGDVLPTMDHSAFAHGQAAIVAGAHSTHMAPNAHLLALEPSALARSECAMSDAIADALLLLELALDDRVLCLCGRGLGECKGRRCSECRHKNNSK